MDEQNEWILAKVIDLNTGIYRAPVMTGNEHSTVTLSNGGSYRIKRVLTKTLTRKRYSTQHNYYELVYLSKNILDLDDFDALQGKELKKLRSYLKRIKQINIIDDEKIYVSILNKTGSIINYGFLNREKEKLYDIKKQPDEDFIVKENKEEIFVPIDTLSKKRENRITYQAYYKNGSVKDFEGFIVWNTETSSWNYQTTRSYPDIYRVISNYRSHSIIIDEVYKELEKKCIRELSGKTLIKRIRK